MLRQIRSLRPRSRHGLWRPLTTALAIAATAANVSAHAFAAPVETIIAQFGGTNGDEPSFGGLVRDATGALYGKTHLGGAGFGVVYKLVPPALVGGAWKENVLYTFSGGADGANPYSALLLGPTGALFGTTLKGGATGNGVVFKLVPPTSAGGPWTEKVIYNFMGDADGSAPIGNLVLGAGGALFGTTLEGGNAACALGCGTVYKLLPPAVAGGLWSKVTLYSFAGGTDGSYPYSGVTRTQSGTIYSTTYQGGGSDACVGGCGTIYELTPPSRTGEAWTETVLLAFSGTDGMFPWAGVTVAPSGALFTAASEGGICSDGCGTVVRLLPPTSAGALWTETVVASFDDGQFGGKPASTLLFDAAGNIYGTNALGGTGSCSNGCGTVFALSPVDQWGVRSIGVIHEFQGGIDGNTPSGNLLMAASGALFGTTVAGGHANEGTVYKVTP